MNINVFYGILIPFLGTSVGAACVIFMKNNSDYLQKARKYGHFTGYKN